MEDVRIDKYLWSIRVFKTRNEATEACKGGKIRVNGSDIKPSKNVKRGDVITARKGAIVYTFKVIDLLDKRVGDTVTLPAGKEAVIERIEPLPADLVDYLSSEE